MKYLISLSFLFVLNAFAGGPSDPLKDLDKIKLTESTSDFNLQKMNQKYMVQVQKAFKEKDFNQLAIKAYKLEKNKKFAFQNIPTLPGIKTPDASTVTSTVMGDIKGELANIEKEVGSVQKIVDDMMVDVHDYTDEAKVENYLRDAGLDPADFGIPDVEDQFCPGFPFCSP